MKASPSPSKILNKFPSSMTGLGQYGYNYCALDQVYPPALLPSVIKQPSPTSAPTILLMAGSGRSPCAACKLLRRRCSKDCIFAPYFTPDQPHKFSIVHKVFGASNVNKMLQELPVHHRADAASSLVYEASARMKDPVYGCAGTISYLHNQVSQLQMQLAVAQAEILCIKMQQESSSSPLSSRHDAHEHKAFVFQHGSFDTPREFINYSSSRNHVAQEPLKRESPWP